MYISKKAAAKVLHFSTIHNFSRDLFLTMKKKNNKILFRG